MISHTMNKLIKRTPPPLLFLPPLSILEIIRKSKSMLRKRGREVGRKKERGRSRSETENVCVCRSTTTRRKRRGVEPIGEERGKQERKAT